MCTYGMSDIIVVRKPGVDKKVVDVAINIKPLVLTRDYACSCKQAGNTF